MTMAKLASEIAKREGKKSQAKIGDIREVLKLLVMNCADEFERVGDPTPTLVLLTSEVRKELMKRAKRSAKKKAKKA